MQLSDRLKVQHSSMPQPSPSPTNLAAALVAVAAICGIVALRLPFFSGDLLKSDEAVYAVTARAWSQGLLPGRDIWDNKPPGMPALYRLSGVTGDMILGSRLAALVLSIVTLLATLGLARLAAPRLPSWPVALAYMLVTHANGWPMAEWVVLNGEIPSTACTALCALCLAAWARRQSWGLLVAAGICAGLAPLFRQTAFLPVAGMAGWLAWAATRRGGWRRLLQSLGLALAGLLVAWIPLISTYVAQDALPYLWQACGGRGLAYAAQAVPLEQALSSLRSSLSAGLLPVLLALGVIGVALAVAKGLRQTAADRPVLWLLVSYGLGSGLSVLPGGHLFDHYFLQLAPAWALAAGLVTAWLMRRPRPVFRTAGVALGLLGLLALAGRIWSMSTASPLEPYRECNRELFGEVSAAIRARTASYDRIVVWAWAPQVYWLSDRLPAARDITLNYALGWIGGSPQELFPGARDALLADLKSTSPAVIAVPNDHLLPFSQSPAWQPEHAPEMWALIRQRYRLSQRLPHWDLYELRG